MIRATVEYIWHFSCEDCLGWWSIASHENYKPKKMYCPHCGKHQTQIETRSVQTGEKV